MTDLKVADVMRPKNQIPCAGPKTLLKVALEDMTRQRLGVTSVVDDSDKLLGIFTDGDIRRMLLKEQKPFSALFADDIIVHARKNPAVIPPDMPLSDAIVLMEEKEVWDLPVVDGDGKLVGLLHLHPAIKAVLGLDT